MKSKLLFFVFFFLSSICATSQISFSLNSNGCTGSFETVSVNTGTNAALAYTWTSSPASAIFNSPNSQTTTITFPSAGSFTIGITIQLSSGTSYTSHVITIIASPTIFTAQTNGTTCIANNFPLFSKPVILTANGASAYTWTPNASGVTGNIMTVRPSTSTCYTVIGSNAACSASAVACVTVIPQFSFAVTPPSGTICNSQSLTLNIINIQNTAVGPSSSFTYSWTENINTSSLSISNTASPTVQVFPQNSSTYSVEVSDAAACVSLPVLVNINVQPCTAIDAHSLSNDLISLYPNPVKDKLFFQFSTQSIEITYLSITNNLGQVVYSLNNQSLKQEIDLRFLAT